jgi:hypothetical protein
MGTKGKEDHFKHFIWWISMFSWRNKKVGKLLWTLKFSGKIQRTVGVKSEQTPFFLSFFRSSCLNFFKYWSLKPTKSEKLQEKRNKRSRIEKEHYTCGRRIAWHNESDCACPKPWLETKEEASFGFVCWIRIQRLVWKDAKAGEHSIYRPSFSEALMASTLLFFNMI